VLIVAEKIGPTPENTYGLLLVVWSGSIEMSIFFDTMFPWLDVNVKSVTNEVVRTFSIIGFPVPHPSTAALVPEDPDDKFGSVTAVTDIDVEELTGESEGVAA